MKNVFADAHVGDGPRPGGCAAPPRIMARNDYYSDGSGVAVATHAVPAAAWKGRSRPSRWRKFC